MESLQDKMTIFYVCARNQTNGPPVNDQASSTGSCNCCHALSARWCTHPPPPVPPFLLVQTMSLKRIAPTDNIQPKSDNAKKGSQKGYETLNSFKGKPSYGEIVIICHLNNQLTHSHLPGGSKNPTFFAS